MTTPESFLPDFTKLFCSYLGPRLKQLAGDAWWNKLVYDKLSYSQRQICNQHGYHSLEDLDLLGLLRVFQGSFQEFHLMDDVPLDRRPLFYELANVRHRAAHAGTADSRPEDTYRDLDTMLRVLDSLKKTGDLRDRLDRARTEALEQLAPERVIEIEKIREVFVPAETTNPIPEGSPRINLGDWNIYGPMETTIRKESTLSGDESPKEALVSIFRATNADHVHLNIGFFEFENGEQMVTTVSRLNSSEEWDNLVKRVRVGVRTVSDDPEKSFIQIRKVAPKREGNLWPTRHKTDEEDLDLICGFPTRDVLTSQGIYQYGTRGSVTGNTGKNRNELCATFKTGDPIPAVVIYVLSTLCPYLKMIEAG